MFGKFFKLVFLVLIIVAIVVAITPMNWYYRHIDKHLLPMKLEGISGTAVKGTADKLKYQLFDLGQVNWLLYPNGLNSIGGRVKLTGPEYGLIFELAQVKKNTLDFNAISGFVGWDLIKKYLQMNQRQLQGDFSFNLRQVRIDKQNGIKGASGNITLNNFQLVQPRKIDLGEIMIDFETQQQGMIVGTISSRSNVMNVSGALFLQPNRYKLNLDIMPNPGQYELEAAFRNVGNPRRGGGRRLNLAGFY